MVKRHPTYIDLFAGCGGLSLGLYKSGWNGLFALEKSPGAFNTLKHNLIDNNNHFTWPEWLPQQSLDIDQIINDFKSNLINLRGKVDLVAGGPPCQGFSTAGRRKENDVRNGLIKSYLRFIMYVQPKVIFFENVKGFTQKFEKHKSQGLAYSQYVLKVLKRFGYEVEGQMINFSNFGIPQKRTRFILVGVRKDLAAKNNISAKLFFQYISDKKNGFLNKNNLPQNPKLGDAISDLLKENGLMETPDRKNFKSGLYSRPKSSYQKFLRKKSNPTLPNSHSYPKHKPSTEEKFNYFIQNNEANKNIDRSTRIKFNINKHTIITLSENHVAPTITTLPDDYVHYCEPRILTVRELARIQSFPDWYEFVGKYTTGGKFRTLETPRYTQVGNAIPPLFAEQAGIVLKEMIQNG